MPPSPSTVAMQEGWEIDSPAPQAAEQPQGPPPAEPPTPAVGGDDQAYYEAQLHIRFLGPPPEGVAPVSMTASEALDALAAVCEQAIRNRPALTFAGKGYGVLRKDK